MHHYNSNAIGKYEAHLRKKKLVILIIAIFTCISAIWAVSLGPTNLGFTQVVKTLFGFGDTSMEAVIFNIRLPRIVTALVVGASLGLSGVVMQCVLNNPLASASTLGVSQGAAFGAAIGIIVFGGGVVADASATYSIEINSPYIVVASALFFALLSTALIIVFSRISKNMGAASLVLAGVAISSLFTGGSALLQYFADDSKISALVFWTFGNLGNASWGEIIIITIILVLIFIYFVCNRWTYNAMKSGMITAGSLGVDTKKTMLIGMGLSSLVAAVAVSFVGIISFIGLVAPHIVRRLVGDDYRHLIPATAIMGGLILLLADTLARMIISPVVLPVGAITSFLGAPLFLWLLIKEGRRL